MRIAFLIVLIFIALKSFAGEEHPAEGSSRAAPGMAVTEFNQEDGFKMSEAALKTLGVSFAAISGNSPWKIPREAVVNLKHAYGVYRRYENWISFVLVKIIKSEGQHLWIQSVDLEAGDEIAVTGAPFLRMTEADLNSDTSDACAH